MAVVDIIKKLNYDENKLLKCPCCLEKKLFPMPDQAFNSLQKDYVGGYVCADCGVAIALNNHGKN